MISPSCSVRFANQSVMRGKVSAGRADRTRSAFRVSDVSFFNLNSTSTLANHDAASVAQKVGSLTSLAAAAKAVSAWLSMSEVASPNVPV